MAMQIYRDPESAQALLDDSKLNALEDRAKLAQLSKPELLAQAQLENPLASIHFSADQLIQEILKANYEGLLKASQIEEIMSIEISLPAQGKKARKAKKAAAPIQAQPEKEISLAEIGAIIEQNCSHEFELEPAAPIQAEQEASQEIELEPAAPIQEIEQEAIPMLAIEPAAPIQAEQPSDIRLAMAYLEGPIQIPLEALNIKGFAPIPAGYEPIIPAGYRIYHNSPLIPDSKRFYAAKKLASGWMIYGQAGDWQHSGNLRHAWAHIQLKHKYQENPSRAGKALPWPHQENEDYYILRGEISPDQKKAQKSAQASKPASKPASNGLNPDQLASALNFASMENHAQIINGNSISLAYARNGKLFLRLRNAEGQEIALMHECSDAEMLFLFNALASISQKAS